jgi:hypothetical protein
MNHPFKRKKKAPKMAPPPSPLFTWTDEDQAYVDKMLMKDARKNFRKLISRTSKKEPEPSEHPFPKLDKKITELEIKTGNKKGPITSIKNCRKCYFAAAVRTYGLNWYIRCSNVAKSRGHNRDYPWILAKSNLPCWRDPE